MGLNIFIQEILNKIYILYTVIRKQIKVWKLIEGKIPVNLSGVGLNAVYSKTCVKRPLKNRQNKDLNNNWLLNEGRKYCRMLHLEHSAILLTCIYSASLEAFCNTFDLH